MEQISLSAADLLHGFAFEIGKLLWVRANFRFYVYMVVGFMGKVEQLRRLFRILLENTPEFARNGLGIRASGKENLILLETKTKDG